MHRAVRVTSTVVVCAVGLASIAGLRADVRASKRDAALLKQKVATINDRAARPSKVARRITITENEVNSYLAYEARDQIPVGVVDPSITVIGPGRLSARAVVDLDAVRKQKAPTSLLDPMNYLMGRLAVTAVGTLRTANGVGRIDLESSSVGSIPIPKILLQEIVSYYSRSAQKPGGIGLDDPFPLPSRIREIQVERGQAIIVQ
jgi:hypothetical protein